MGYTQVALEDKILEMYPEIREKHVSPRISFDTEKNTWNVKLVSGSKEATFCLDKEEADACMDNRYCERFGKEIGKYLKDVA
jgi:hypothetical protein